MVDYPAFLQLSPLCEGLLDIFCLYVDDLRGIRAVLKQSLAGIFGLISANNISDRLSAMKFLNGDSTSDIKSSLERFCQIKIVVKLL